MDSFYPYCEDKYLEFKYRQPLLIHELISKYKLDFIIIIQKQIFFSDFNADILFLQECDEEFFNNGLNNSLLASGYSGKFLSKAKESQDGEGEAVLFRSDRFR